MSTHAVAAASPSSIVLRVALWIGQVLLAAMFLMAGGMKVAATEQFPYPAALTIFIGIAELTGAVGVMVPAITRIKPILTPIAAGALGLVMVLATGVHAYRAEPLAMTIGLAALALFVAWGRGFKAPLQPR